MFTLRHFHAHKVRLWLITVGLLTLINAFTPTQYIHAKELIGAGSPVWSPSGRQIAYTIYQNQQSDLYTIDVDGSTPIKLADNAGQPKWSPDGKRIVYTSYDSNTGTINLVDVSSRAITKLSTGFSPNWSPDGKQLLYVADDGLFIANADGSTPGKMIVDRALRVWDAAWSPDGKRIALASQGKTDNSSILSIINSDGSGLNKISESTDEVSLSWSPDGSQLIFVGDCGEQSHGNICIVNADGTNPRSLLHSRSAVQPIWSPDGKQILFTNGNLYLMNADGTNQHQLTGHKAQTEDREACWSPDGKHILFTRMHFPSSTGGEPYIVYFEVYMMSVDGSHMRRLPDGLAIF